MNRRAGIVLESILVALVAGSPQLADAATLEQVKQRGALRLCANPSALPYSNNSPQAGPPGFQLELAEAMADAMGLKLIVAWTQGITVENKARCDAFMDSLDLGSAARYEREGRTGPTRDLPIPVRLSKAYAGGGVVLAVRAGSTVRRFDELKQQEVGVVVGSLAHEVLAKKGFNVSSFAFDEDVVVAIDRGEIRAGAVVSPALGWYRHEHPRAKVTIPQGYDPEPELRWNSAVALWQADDALVATVNAAVDRVIAKGVPEQVYAKYGVSYHLPWESLR